jgi:hypothetical protein
MAGDLFGYNAQTGKKVYLADKAKIMWDGELAGATQVSVTYAQQINRRRTIGNKDATIYGSQPQGNINIQRLVFSGGEGGAIFSKTGWDACKDAADISIYLGEGCANDGGGGGAGGGLSWEAKGCRVSQYSLQMEAESLTVADNVVIEFLQLIY